MAQDKNPRKTDETFDEKVQNMLDAHGEYFVIGYLQSVCQQLMSEITYLEGKLAKPTK